MAKDPKGLFDKLTVRLAGRYISFLRLGVEKPDQPKVSEGRKEGKHRGILGMAKSLRFVIPRSEATWEFPVKCFEFAEIFLKFRTVLRDCHGPFGASQ